VIDGAGRSIWDGTKEENGTFLIAGYGPVPNIEVPQGPYAGGDPTSLTLKTPHQIEWKNNAGNRTANLVGDPSKPGLYVQMLTWLKGDHFGRPHSHPNDRFIFVLSGTWWAGTGTTFDPTNFAVPLKAGTFATHFAKQVHWDGARDEDAALLIIAEGPATNTPAEAGK
jgi:hypothetical protein